MTNFLWNWNNVSLFLIFWENAILRQFWNIILSGFVMNGFKSRHPRCSVKKGILRNFVKFTGKNLCQKLFSNKVAGLRPANLLKKRLWHGCFPVNFTEFLWTPFFTEHLWTTASVGYWSVPYLLKYCYSNELDLYVMTELFSTFVVVNVN